MVNTNFKNLGKNIKPYLKSSNLQFSPDVCIM